MITQRKAKIGQAYTFQWWAPAPISGTPSLTVRIPGNAYTGNLTAIASSVTIVATDQSRTLLSAQGAISGTAEGISGDAYGQAWLQCGDGGTYPVTVASIDTSGACVSLARALPAQVSLPAVGATLAWSVYTATIPASKLTAKHANVEWHVAYTRQDGADSPASAETASGQMRIVRAPFDTGLTHHSLTRTSGHLRRIGPPMGAADWSAVIDEARAVLIEKITPKIREAGGETEDDVRGSQFAQLHLDCVRLCLIRERVFAGDMSTDAMDDWENRIDERIDTLFRGGVWVDVDDDGEADDGEVEAQAGPNVAGGAWSDSSVYGTDGTYDRWSVTQER